MKNEKKSTSQKKQNTKKVETKKNILETMDIRTMVILVLIAILAVASMCAMYFKAKDTTYGENWQNKSYLVEKELAPLLKCEEIPNVILGNESMILVTSFNEEEFELEKDLAKLIKQYNIKDFYVYPVNDACGSVNDLGSTVSKNLKLTKGLTKIPTILYYRNGSLMEIVEREDQKILDVGDFQKLLDIYEIAK